MWGLNSERSAHTVLSLACGRCLSHIDASILARCVCVMKISCTVRSTQRHSVQVLAESTHAYMASRPRENQGAKGVEAQQVAYQYNP